MTKGYKVENDTIITRAVLNSAYKLTKEIDGEKVVKNVINITPDDTSIFEKIVAFKESGSKYTPDWFKGKEHIILRSTFDIPVKNTNGDKISFDSFLQIGLIKGAIVNVRFTQKDGAVYPVAMVVEKEGTEYNPFEGM